MVNNPISIFILDISNSSLEAQLGEVLTDYLDEVVRSITEWTRNAGHIKVKHRAGDEIIFVGQGYSIAYTIAFFISRVWKYSNHKPYFGLAFGDIDKNLAEIDIEKWIHPLVKQARYANDFLKQEAHDRPQFRFELDQFIGVDNSFTQGYNEFRIEFESLLNTLLILQHKNISSQTEIQGQVCSLYLIFQKQKEIATILGKTAPTISSHFKKGNSEEILLVFSKIVDILISLEEKTYLNQNSIKKQIEQLNESIRSNLKENIDSIIG